MVTHPRAAQADLGVIRRFKGGADERLKGKEVVSHVGGGLDTHGRLPYLLPHLPPGSRERGVGLSLYLSEVAASQMTLQQGSLQMR
jgi:hypothetical protein